MNNNLEALIKELLDKVPGQYHNIVLEAISWAQKQYVGENRLSGGNIIFHALRVANIAGDFHLDTDSILVAILHCLLKEKRENNLERNTEEIKQKFGEDVLNLLLILQKINQGTDSIETDRATITRYVLRNSEDIRGILLKICDVLDDVRTIEYLPEEEIKLKAKKVYDIYAPLCSYLNLEPVKKEIEEKAFNHTLPQEYEVIEEKMQEEGLNEELLNKYINELENHIDILNYRPKIFGRIKSKYSVYNKLKKLENEGRGTALSQIKDRIAFSIITHSNEDCFLVKMGLEEQFEVDDKETDDYINNPKPNGFQALHMVLSCTEVRPNIFIEVQILTEKMYYINTYGPASHIAYKASKTRYAKPTDSFKWIEDLHKGILKSKNSRKQLRSVPIKADVFKNYIYIFTPKGRIIELSKDATALDFAYRVHTRIGHNAMFAQVNNGKKDLSATLETGDVVNIVTSNQDKFPKREWLEFAKTDSAKEKIRKAIKAKALNLK